MSTSNSAYHICLEQAKVSSYYLYLSWSGSSDLLFLATIYIGSGSISPVSTVMTLGYSTSPSSYFFRTHFFERNSVIWGFSRSSSSEMGAATNFGYLFKFKDYTGPSWDESCSIQSTSSSYFS